MSSPKVARVDVFVCEGRVCTSNGAALVAAALTTALAQRDEAASSARVQRGGCYGLCDLGPNVVVRRAGAGVGAVAVDESADRLSLRGGASEDVCVAVAVADVAALVDGIVEAGRAPAHLLRAVREPAIAPRSPIEARLRALRARRGTTKGFVDDDGQGGA